MSLNNHGKLDHARFTPWNIRNASRLSIAPLRPFWRWEKNGELQFL
jgi:hypothetical protein